MTILDYGLNAAGSRNTFLVDGNRALRFISGGTNANIQSSSSAITAGQWTHVAFVLDNGIGYLYVNGVQVGTGSLSSVNTPAGNANLNIRQRVSGGNIPFEGLIDEVRIWDVARTASEISANMNNEFCGPSSGLVAHFSMDGGISNGNNTTLIKVANSVNSGDGFLINFALTGSTSNFTNPGAAINQPTFDSTVSQVGFTLIANDSLADIYQWIDCSTNNALTNDTLQTFTASYNGDFALVLIKNGCSDTSACVTVMSVGLEKQTFDANFRLSQNLISNTFSIYNKNSVTVNSTVRSINGSLIEKRVIINKDRIHYDLSDKPSGIYFVTIQADNGLQTNFKIVKK